MKVAGAMARVGLIGLGAVLAPGPLAAQERWTEEAIVAGVQTSFALQASRASAAADAERPGQVRWPFPMVEVMPMPGMLLDGEVGAQVMARQTIPWPGRLSADRTARLRMAEAGAHEADALSLDLVAAARMTFAELWGLQEQVARIQEYVTQLALYREAALAQYATGRGPQQAVLGIQLEAEILAQRLEALREDQAGLVARIEALTGGSIRIGLADRLAPPAAGPGPTPEPGGASGAAVAAYRAALADHPVLTAGRAMVEAEESMAAMSRTMLRPEFTVGVTLNLSRMAWDRVYGQEPVMPAAGLTLPLWRGGVRAQIREAELRATARELETAAARVRLEAELDDVLTQLDRVRTRIARYEGQLRPQVRQTLEASLAGYQAGVTRFLELLDAQRVALDVEVDLIMARVREAALVARLDAVTGRALEDA
jgi:outer membrane protein, heavy metal efflux system